MLIKNISFITYFKDITNIENSNIDIFVKLEDTYTVVVATAKNIEFLMDKKKMNYFEPGYPFMIVQKLTKEIITEAIEAYLSDNPYW